MSLVLDATADVARQIVMLATSEASGTGRRSRLQETAIVESLLSSLREGCSRMAAAKRAGVSEGIFRRWLTAEGRPVGACLALQAAVAAIESAPAPCVAVSLVVTPPPALTSPAPAAPVVVRPVPASALVQSWAAMAVYIGRLRRENDPHTASYLQDHLSADLRMYGLAEVPARFLPADLSWSDVQRRFMGWCHESRVGVPCEAEFDSAAQRWFRDHAAGARALPGKG